MAENTNPLDAMSALRELFDLFTNLYVEVLSLRQAAEDSKAIPLGLVQKYSDLLKGSDELKQSRERFSSVQPEVLLELLRNYKGPIQ